MVAVHYSASSLQRFETPSEKDQQNLRTLNWYYGSVRAH
jgi:hypothetical protein